MKTFNLIGLNVGFLISLLGFFCPTLGYSSYPEVPGRGSETKTETPEIPVIEEMWDFELFQMRGRPIVEVDVPAFLSVQLVLEFELVWQKDSPVGWSSYQFK